MAAKPSLRVVGQTYHDLLGEIRSSHSTFHASEKAIAETIMSNPISISEMNISQLAEASGTSVASVVRFCKTLGFKGFPDFRMELVREVSRMGSIGAQPSDLDGGITIDDSPAQVIAKIAAADALAIQTTAEKLDPKVFAQVVALMDKAQTVATFGVASSGYVAMDAQLKLNRLGKSSVAWRDAHSALTSISLLKRGDLLIAISHSGTTLDIVDVISAFKERGIRVVLITNGMRSPAANLSDLVLYTSARETTFRSGATASRIAQLTVVDCLCVALAQRNWSGTKAALDESRAAISSRSGRKMGETIKNRSLSKTRTRGGNK